MIKNRMCKTGYIKPDVFFRTHMFGVPGQHTFFFPVDSAFDVSVQLSGYDYERGRPTGLNKMGVSEKTSGLMCVICDFEHRF